MDETPREHAKRIINLDMDRTDPVSVQRYTRTGKLKKPMEREPSPGSLHALEVHRAGTQFDGPNARRCTKCRRLAVRGISVCYWHGGKAVLRVRRRALKQGAVGKTSDIALRNTRRVFNEGGIPNDLMHNPLFQQVAKVALPNWFSVPRSKRETDIGRRVASRVLVRELVAAWFAYEDGDYQPWLRATTKARELGFGV